MKEPTKMKTITFQHINMIKGFDVLKKNPKGTHGCLRMGHWCWKNALERPQDIISYFKNKLRRSK